MAIRRVPLNYGSFSAAALAANPGDTILISSSYVGSKTATIRDNNLFINASAAVTGLLVKMGPGVTKVTLKGSSHIDVQGNGLSNVITGNSGDNTFLGGGGADTLKGGLGFDTADYRTAKSGVIVNLTTGKASGGGGADTLFAIEEVRGSNSADKLTGNSGDNWLMGRRGNDALIGGAGFDTADYRNASGTVIVNLTKGTASGADGSDKLSSIEGVRGSAHNDVLTGNKLNNVIRGMKGDDSINGGAGIDQADYRNADGGVVVNLLTGTASGADGNDTLIGIENICGSNFNDTLTGNGLDNWIRGRVGNDTLAGGGGWDVADYRDAAGSVVVNLATGTASGADGNDTLSGFEAIRGGDFSDTLTGDSNDNAFRGGRGNDTIVGAGGWDIADYEEARAGVRANLTTGIVSGGDGNDTLSGIEELRGSAFADRLTGDGFDNWLAGRGGNDIINGGGGFDLVDYREATGAVTVNLATGKATGADGADTLTNIEDVRGSHFSDVLIGSATNNMLRGMRGNDTINGGAGNDWADYRNANGAVTVSLATGKSSGADGVDTLINIERIRGGAFNDTLTGNTANNRFRGMGGDDSINGGEGFDTASYRNATGSVTVNLAAGNTSGADGIDTLTSIEAVEGSGFADFLIGSAESNTIHGGFGADTMMGGGGPDNFSYDSASEGGDTITDFEAEDVFLFNRAGFGLAVTGTTLGEVGAVFRTGAGVTSADAASPSFIYDTITARLLFDADGTGATNAPVLIATLANGFALTADDLRFF